MLISKLPQEIQLIATRTLGNKDWDLDELMKIFEEELQVRERATTVLATNTRKAIKDTPTAATLFTGDHLTFSYCQGNHPSNSCGVVPQPDARKQVLQRAGRCFVCLRRGHVSRACRLQKRCPKCNGRHHISICSHETQNSPPQTNPDEAEPGKPSSQTTPST